MTNDSRAVVLQALQLLAKGRNLPDALSSAGLAGLPARDRAFARRLAQHAVRHRRRLQLEITTYLKRPNKNPQIAALLWLGAAQIELDDIPPHAAVDSTVSLAPPRLRGLLNAVLRRRLREPPAERQGWGEQASFPDWWVDAIKRDWSGQTLPILQALNTEPVQCLRVNRQQLSREAWLQRLDETLLLESLGDDPAQSDGLLLRQNTSITALPGFDQGQVSVQGASAQAAAHLMQLQAGQQVLDACSAPGGKTAHMLEQQPDIQLLALDVDAQRMARVTDNLQRLGLHAETQVGDVMQTSFDAARFDRILLDVPCSGSGVIARHPDIKWLRREADLASLAQRQLAMLQRAWSWLKPGGQLLYCTCSILRVENDAVIEAFVAEQTDARADELNLPFGQASAYGWRVAPLPPHEGFYFSRLVKA